MKSNTQFHLPQDLPPKTAMALFDLLSELIDAIWEQYETGLVELIIEELHLEQDPQQSFDFNDDIPF